MKSPDLPPSQSQRVPLLKQLTSTLTKPGTLPAFPSSGTREKSLVSSRLSQQKTVLNINSKEDKLKTANEDSMKEESQLTVKQKKCKEDSQNVSML